MAMTTSCRVETTQEGFKVIITASRITNKMCSVWIKSGIPTLRTERTFTQLVMWFEETHFDKVMNILNYNTWR